MPLLLRILLVTGCLLALRLVYGTASLPVARPKNMARGFGDHLNWRSFPDGLMEARTERKPILMLIHQEVCKACKDLAPRIAEDGDIAELSKYFTMINCKDFEEPTDPAFAPDGHRYYPRILFLSPDGKVLSKVCNQMGSKGYRYYYFSPKHIADSMVSVMKMFYDLDYDDAEDL